MHKFNTRKTEFDRKDTLAFYTQKRWRWQKAISHLMTKLYSLFNLCNELKLLQGSQRTSWLREDRSYKYLKLLSCLVKKKKSQHTMSSRTPFRMTAVSPIGGKTNIDSEWNHRKCWWKIKTSNLNAKTHMLIFSRLDSQEALASEHTFD